MQTKARTMRDQSVTEIGRAIEEKRGALGKFRFELAAREVKNYRLNGMIRREIARLKTVLSEKRSEQ